MTNQEIEKRFSEAFTALGKLRNAFRRQENHEYYGHITVLSMDLTQIYDGWKVFSQETISTQSEDNTETT